MTAADKAGDSPSLISEAVAAVRRLRSGESQSEAFRVAADAAAIATVHPHVADRIDLQITDEATGEGMAVALTFFGAAAIRPLSYPGYVPFFANADAIGFEPGAPSDDVEAHGFAWLGVDSLDDALDALVQTQVRGGWASVEPIPPELRFAIPRQLVFVKGDRMRVVGTNADPEDPVAVFFEFG